MHVDSLINNENNSNHFENHGIRLFDVFSVVVQHYSLKNYHIFNNAKQNDTNA